MRNSKWKDIGVRALKTFLQAFLASITVDTQLFTADGDILRSILLSATAAGLSAVMNLSIGYLQDDYI